MKRTLAAGVFLAMLLSACGGGGRPSADEIADALNDEGNVLGIPGSVADDDAIDCIAKALHDSDLSDELLRALVDGDEDYEGDKDDEAALTKVITEDLAKCAPDLATP